MKKKFIKVIRAGFSILLLLPSTGLLAQNPSMIADINPGSGSSAVSHLAIFNNKLFFQANDGINGAELWMYDGTNAPSMVADINPGSSSSSPINFTVFRGKLYFRANDGINGTELYMYDDIHSVSLVADITPGSGSSYPAFLTVFNNKLYFQAGNLINGMELWEYDGSNAPVMTANIRPGSDSSWPAYLTIFNGKLYFQANDGISGYELWKYDGINPPSMIADISAGEASSLPSNFVVIYDKLYFQANNGITGAELWHYNGVNPPSMVADIFSGTGSSTPLYLVKFNNKLFFQANNGTTGAELWKYDGANPPSIVADIYPGENSSSPTFHTIFNDKLYFRADNGINGTELWGYDGDTNPAMVADIRPGSYGSSPAFLTYYKFKFYFQAQNGTDGYELWVLTDCSASSASVSTIACDSYTVPSGDETYTMSGIYTDTIPNVGGCDSIISINVTINSGNTGSQTAAACNSYTWPANGNTYTASGIYSATLTNVSGCDSVLTLNLTITTIDNTVSQNNDVLISNTTGASYQWLDCDSGNMPIAGETGQSFTATSNGNFAVVVTKGSCTDTSACYSVVGLEILENNFGTSLFVFPNPTNGQLTILLGQLHESIEVIVKNVNGQIISSHYFKSSGKVDFTIEKSTGIYFIEIRSGKGETARIKVIKQ